MQNIMKSCIVITSLLLMLVPAYSADNSQQPENDLLSTVLMMDYGSMIH